MFIKMKEYAPLAAALAVYFVGTQWLFGTVCPVLFVVGVPCPGCGLTRAGLLFLGGQWVDSWRMHPLVVPTVAFVGLAGWSHFFRPGAWRWVYGAGGVLVVVMVGLYVFRMITVFPYEAPMQVNNSAIFRQIFAALEG